MVLTVFQTTKSGIVTTHTIVTGDHGEFRYISWEERRTFPKSSWSFLTLMAILLFLLFNRMKLREIFTQNPFLPNHVNFLNNHSVMLLLWFIFSLNISASTVTKLVFTKYSDYVVQSESDEPIGFLIRQRNILVSEAQSWKGHQQYLLSLKSETEKYEPRKCHEYGWDQYPFVQVQFKLVS